MIARLPGVAIQTLSKTGHPALFFRFKGGIGVVPADAKLNDARPVFSIFLPRYHHLGGVETKNTGPCVLPKPPSKWDQFVPIPGGGKPPGLKKDS